VEPLSEPCPACGGGGTGPEDVAAARQAMADWMTQVREARATFAQARADTDMPGNPWDHAAWKSSREYAAVYAQRPAAAPPIGCRDCAYVGTVPTADGRAVLDFLAVHGEQV